MARLRWLAVGVEQGSPALRGYVCAAACVTVVLAMTGCGSSSSSGPVASGSGSSQSSASGSATSAPAAGASSSGPGASQGASPHVAGPPPCPTSGLQVRLGASNGAAGSTYLPIVFTNTGTTACTLYGYPGVSLAGGSPAAQIGAAAVRNPSPAPKTVTLAPGGEANAVLQVTVAGNYPAATCNPTAATTLVVYPPNQTASVSVPYSTTGCAAQGVSILHVSVVQAGAGG